MRRKFNLGFSFFRFFFPFSGECGPVFRCCWWRRPKEEKIIKKKTLLAVLRLFRGPSFNWLGHWTLTHTSPTYLVRSDWTWRLANRTSWGGKKKRRSEIYEEMANLTGIWWKCAKLCDWSPTRATQREVEKEKGRFWKVRHRRQLKSTRGTLYPPPSLHWNNTPTLQKCGPFFSLAWPPPLFVEGGEVRFPISPLVHWTLTEK